MLIFLLYVFLVEGILIWVLQVVLDDILPHTLLNIFMQLVCLTLVFFY